MIIKSIMLLIILIGLVMFNIMVFRNGTPMMYFITLVVSVGILSMLPYDKLFKK